MRILYLIVVALLVTLGALTHQSDSYVYPKQTPITIPAPALYPARLANAAQDTIVDRYGMDNRECVSYVAWRVQVAHHDMPDWTEAKTGISPDAKNWPLLAAKSHIPFGFQPRVGSVAIAEPNEPVGNNLVAGEFGHAMWVEAVNDDGTVSVSQYNYSGLGEYSTARIASNDLVFIYF